jgi:hypothetical protein
MVTEPVSGSEAFQQMRRMTNNKKEGIPESSTEFDDVSVPLESDGDGSCGKDSDVGPDCLFHLKHFTDSMELWDSG